MKKLDIVKKKNGFTYRQIMRTSKVAMYAQFISPEDEAVLAYEVFKIKIQKERHWNCKCFPNKERFPSNEDFGKTAWTYCTYKIAYLKYQELVRTTSP